ncbi:MAG: hypothetical protein KZQ72_03140 [Candidatus Thiodiazotropha sp. (ex Cardiolucina cf. quadrata)]|nr:hypothetical protein [Candidatus Thiodiazotropha sp. (ex Cardiolucina cf. quadrata)]
MANRISKQDIEQFPLKPYADMRKDLQTGDLVFCSGSYFFHKPFRNSPTPSGAMWE